MEQAGKSPIRVGHFPYRPSFNPYQSLFAGGLESAGLNVVRIPPRRFGALQFALSHDIDILHMDWPHSFYRGRNRLSTWAKRRMYFAGLRKLREFPCVWTLHNLVAHDAADRADEMAMVQPLIESVSAVMVMSETAGRLLRETYRVPERVRVEVVPMGHYIDCYPNKIGREAARKRLGIAPGARVVLFLGRIERYKGCVELLHAFAKVARSNDVLLIAGPPASADLAAEIQRMAAELCPQGAEIRVEPGLVPDDDLQVYFQASDVTAMPFRNILNSSMLMTAMSFGRAAIAPNIGSLPEVACPEGFFGYDAEDPEALARTLRDALSRDDLLERGKRCREFVRERYDWGGIGRKLRRLYEEILGGNR